MLSERMLKAINEQVAKEWYSAYLYMSMASYFEVESLEGFAHWLRIQAQEELCHGQIFYNYVSDHGHRVLLGNIKAPQADFASPLDVFRQGLEHEKTVTASINNLTDIAVEDRDHTTRQFLGWFLDEQVEEERNFGDISARLERLPSQTGGEGLLFLDNQFGARVFVVPAPLAGKL